MGAASTWKWFGLKLVRVVRILYLGQNDLVVTELRYLVPGSGLMIQMGRSGLAWFTCGSSSHPRRLCHLITGGGDGAAAVAAAAVRTWDLKGRHWDQGDWHRHTPVCLFVDPLGTPHPF